MERYITRTIEFVGHRERLPLLQWISESMEEGYGIKSITKCVTKSGGCYKIVLTEEMDTIFELKFGNINTTPAPRGCGCAGCKSKG